MLKSLLLVLLLIFTIFTGCSNDDDPVTPPPSTGEVLLAEVAGDSVGTASGLSTKSLSITSSMLNFTDRDSARITFFYSGENNFFTNPFRIYYVNDTVNVDLFSDTLSPATTEQFANIIVPSPKVNASFIYRISALSLSGFSYFKFRDLKIYKK